MEFVWIFNGGGVFASAVFSSRERAEAWISERGLSGTLTQYSLDVPVYEWAIAAGLFRPSRGEHSEPSFIARFSSAHQEHYHYEDGGLAS